MNVVDSLSSSVNHGTTKIAQKVHQTARDPSAGKKFLQIVINIFKARDLYTGEGIQKRPMIEAMKGTTDLIEFYGTFKNIMFWINPFSKESLDGKVLQSSIEKELFTPSSHPMSEEQKGVVQSIYEDVMEHPEYYSKGEVRKVIVASLVSHNCATAEQAQSIANRIIVKQKSRSVIQLLSTACFTMADLGSNIMTLKEWNILNLSHATAVAAQIGTQSPVFLFVFNLGVKTAVGTMASAGLFLNTGKASYLTIVSGIKSYRGEANAQQEFRNALLDLFSSGTDLAATAVPLIFSLNPLTVVGFALVAKTTGLICILAR
jgi:hypothetical protein